MEYEDQARPYTLLSGFLFGTVVGTGLGLIARPLRTRLPARAPGRGRGSTLRDRADRALRAVRAR